MEIYCKICNKGFKSNWDLKRHYGSLKHFKNKYPDEFKIENKCNKCGKIYCSKQSLERHKEICDYKVKDDNILFKMKNQMFY